MVDYYQLYDDLMHFWEAELNKDFFTLNYDLLVGNLEAEVRRLLNYCGLPWDRKCIEPHKNKRLVRTSSKIQIGKKVFSGSSEKWRKYNVFLADSFDRLYL